MQSPLHLACYGGHLSVVKFLMENHADINMLEPRYKMTPLHCAIKNERLSVCKLILEYEQVSTQSIESGITLSQLCPTREIRALLEKTLKSRRKVIMVCVPFALSCVCRVH